MQPPSELPIKPSKDHPLYLKKFLLHMKIQRMLKLWKKKIKKSKHRINILKEWQATQETYIKDLQTIITKIQKPLKQDRIMFPNIDAMIKLSKELLGQIKGFLKNWNPHKTMIGSSLINFHKYFIIYREYCNNFYKSQKILKQLKKQPKCQQIFSSLPMDVQSFAIKPVQRPPKYQLLLREYLKSLPPSHPDTPYLETAVSKYHDVNQQNNQSMDLQIRNQKMIELDKKYGSIINVGRIYLFQEYCRTVQVDGRIKMYVFNDLVLVVKVEGEGDKEREYGWRRVGLDGGSFVDAPMDGKYLVKKLFVCGANDNFHCNFVNSATRDKIFERFQKIIHDLHRKQTIRLKNKNKQKMTVMKIQQIIVKPIPKVRVTVVGVQKRPKSLMNLNININLSFETFYILKIQSPYPSQIFQYTYIKFDYLVALQQKLRQLKKLIMIPVLDDRPQDMNMYDAKKNKTKIIQCRQIYIERFINFVLRSEEIFDCVDLVRKELKIRDEFWQYVCGVGRECQCDVCLMEKDGEISVAQYQEKTQYIRSMVNPTQVLKQMPSIMAFKQNPSLTFKQSPSLVSQASFRQSITSSYQKSSTCIHNTLTLPTKILKTPISQLQTLSRRITWLQCKLGRIDYSLFPSNPSFQHQSTSTSTPAHTQNNIRISISLLSLKQNQTIKIKISRKTTILQILDQVAMMYKIETMRDFGLFMECQDASRMLDRDQVLWDVLDQIGYEFGEGPDDKNKQQQSTFWRTVSNLKKWGSQIILGKKQKLYIRKYLFVNEDIQIKACEDNPQRYSIIVQQIFYRFKYELLILGPVDTKKLCALFYIINNMDKLAHLNQANFQTQKFKAILPQSRWHLTHSQQFQKQVYSYIREYQDLMENSQLTNNSRRQSRGNSNSTMFAGIQIVYNCVIKLVNKALGWSTMFFDVVNYDPPTLPGNCSQLLLGVNRSSLVVIRHKQLQPLLHIPLDKLEYKVTVHSIFVETQEKVFRFDGQIMYDIKKLIQIYKLLGEKFGNK